jgi:hypothetical protein
MKYLLLLLVSFSVQAIEFKVIGPCTDKPLLQSRVSGTFSNVGELTIKTLKNLHIPHSGTEAGIVSIYKTPVGDAALEVLSDYEMRAYGWCYSVDGVSPEIYPDEVPVTSETKSITWHYGFAHYYKGEWISQCTPANSVKPDFICQEKPQD